MSEDTLKKILGYTTLIVALVAIAVAVFNTLPWPTTSING